MKCPNCGGSEVEELIGIQWRFSPIVDGEECHEFSCLRCEAYWNADREELEKHL
jgi:hypothetical protein